MHLLHLRGLVVLATMFIGGNVTFVFAQEARDTQASQLLDVSLSVTGSYDSDAALEAVSITPGFGQIQPEGYSTWGDGSLSYTLRSPRIALQTTASSAVRYLPDLREFQSVSHAGGLRLSGSFPNRFTLALQQSIAYSPSYLYTVFPTLPAAGDDPPLVVTPDPNYDVDSSSSYTSNTSISLERQMNRRTTISVHGDFNHSDFSNEVVVGLPSDSVDLPLLVNQPDLAVYSVGGRFARGMSRNTQMSINYQYRTGEFGYARGLTTAEQSVDLGVELNRRLSATRTLNISVRAGASRVGIPEAVAEFDVGANQFNLTAAATVAYPITRAAQLRGSYTRGLQYVAGLTRPLWVDGFSGEFNGVVLRRIDFLGRVGRSTGQSVFLEARDNLLDTYTGEVRISYFLARQLSAFTEFSYYMYDTGGQGVAPIIPVAPGIPADMQRRAIRVGLLWQVPVLRR